VPWSTNSCHVFSTGNISRGHRKQIALSIYIPFEWNDLLGLWRQIRASDSVIWQSLCMGVTNLHIMLCYVRPIVCYVRQTIAISIMKVLQTQYAANQGRCCLKCYTFIVHAYTHAVCSFWLSWRTIKYYLTAYCGQCHFMYKNEDTKSVYHTRRNSGAAPSLWWAQ